MSKVNLQIPEVLDFLLKPARYKGAYGGRGGAKSWGFARMLLFLSLQKPLRILCTRELQNSIADSVHRLLTDQIYALELDKYFNIQKREITSVNGSLFLFKGLRHNIADIKSTEGIDICWVEEAHKVSEESWNVLIPTIRKENSEIWVSFNPDEIDDPTYRRFVLNSPPDSIIRKVNFSDNPWFPEVLKREMEWDKRTDYDKYLHVWEGEPRTITDAQVFKGKFVIDSFDSPDEKQVTYRYGADWGFAQDPTACVRCFIKDSCLYIDHECYGVGVDIDETPALFKSIPGADKYKVVADSARPETISYMNKQGFNIRPAVKGKGSVEDGIAFIRSFDKVIIHERCKHTAQEFKLYSYKTDRITGEVLPIVLDAHNHIIDALRYALEDLNRRGSVIQYTGW